MCHPCVRVRRREAPYRARPGTGYGPSDGDRPHPPRRTSQCLTNRHWKERESRRALVPEDAEAMFASIQDPEGLRLTGTHAHFTLDTIRAHRARVAAADDRLDYVIALRDDPTYRDEVVLRHIDTENRTASFRVNLAAWAPRGAGLGSEAPVLLLRHGFKVWPRLHRVELEVFDFNPRAIRSYEEVGFVREGLKRDSLWWEDAPHGAVMMSMLRPEFEARYGIA